jgi:hypothetical protein
VIKYFQTVNIESDLAPENLCMIPNKFYDLSIIVIVVHIVDSHVTYLCAGAVLYRFNVPRYKGAPFPHNLYGLNPDLIELSELRPGIYLPFWDLMMGSRAPRRLKIPLCKIIPLIDILCEVILFQ